jgi:hypothetical protein
MLVSESLDLCQIAIKFMHHEELTQVVKSRVFDEDEKRLPSLMKYEGVAQQIKVPQSRMDGFWM